MTDFNPGDLVEVVQINPGRRLWYRCKRDQCIPRDLQTLWRHAANIHPYTGMDNFLGVFLMAVDSHAGGYWYYFVLHPDHGELIACCRLGEVVFTKARLL